MKGFASSDWHGMRLARGVLKLGRQVPLRRDPYQTETWCNVLVLPLNSTVCTLSGHSVEHLTQKHTLIFKKWFGFV